jgi:hypothetical protein
MGMAYGMHKRRSANKALVGKSRKETSRGA